MSASHLRSSSSRVFAVLLGVASLVALSLVAIFALATLSPLTAQAEEEASIWLATGPEGGTYRTVYGKNLQGQMRGTRVHFRDSDGSAANIELLKQSKADVAFVQGDVFASAYAMGEAADLQVIGRLSEECVYIARRVGGDIASFDDLMTPPSGEPANVAVGPPDGGPAGTWRWLSERVPQIAGNIVDDQGGTLALNQLAVGQFDAVVWVTDPKNFEHKMLRTARDNDAIAFMPLTNDALLEPLGDGTVVYKRNKVALEAGWRSSNLETICTSALVLMRRDADSALVEQISDIVGLRRDLIAPPEQRP